ncbi:alpha/beta hydrolase family protein [Alkalimonas collagenimarina]|uniref:Alpha/beta hydrolase family protein n=1 Tax=Alkalimonas collagenimarina TaxID=400390 RepID=A0ABT9GUQ3_9GAMM|nr:alpha/beta hydrolase family protein [Alkalimonas collagenimarina]MDP4534782.1 alpha/beta hydrolase family protein [Alkalimonas collagenimarina]
MCKRFLLIYLCCVGWPSLILAEDGTTDFYLELKPTSYRAAWSGDENIALWKTQARIMLRKALLWPDQVVDFSPELLASEPRQGYRAERWALQVTAESRITVLLLRPDSTEPQPALLLLHDHGARFDIGKEKMIRPLAGDHRLASATEWVERYFSGHFIGDELARQGYLVLAADTFGWSDRGRVEYEQQQALAANFFLAGRSLAGMAAYEDMRLVDFLSGLDGVDADRIGVVGFSMGAFRAWQLAALTDQVKATVAVAWMNRYQDLLLPGNNILRGQSSFYMLHPGLNAQLDIPDVAGIAAPKAMMLINGAQDQLMPIAGVQAAYQRMQQIWQAHDAADQLQTGLWPGAGHEFNAAQQLQAWQWLATQLDP